MFADILGLIRRYGCEESVYITGEGDVLETALSMAPKIRRCCLEGHMNYSIVENALRYQCSRVQFCKLFLTRQMIDTARENGITCNLFWCDDPKEAKRFFEMGIDVILTNNYLHTAQALQGCVNFAKTVCKKRAKARYLSNVRLAKTEKRLKGQFVTKELQKNRLKKKKVRISSELNSAKFFCGKKFGEK